MSVTILSPEQFTELSRYGTGAQFIGLRDGALFEKGQTYSEDDLYAKDLTQDDIELALSFGDLFTLSEAWIGEEHDVDISFMTTPGGEEVVVVEY